MKILVIGSGGREHALAWRLLQSPRASKVYVAPGNAGTAREEGIENVPLTRTADLIEFVNKNNILLTVVGPEAPLADGVVDAFQAAGLRIFGPTQKAAQLESSKDFSKSFMQRHGIPTAAHATFSDAAAAHAYIDQQGAPIVIKADGLAAGKGVVVEDIPAMTTVAIGLTGDFDPNSSLYIDALESWLARNAPDYERDGKMRVMGYNSPFVWKSQRFFEIEIPVKKRTEVAEIAKP